MEERLNRRQRARRASVCAFQISADVYIQTVDAEAPPTSTSLSVTDNFLFPFSQDDIANTTFLEFSLQVEPVYTQITSLITC